MSYAIRNDRQGCRAVDGPHDVGPDEYYSDELIDIVPIRLITTTESLLADVAAKRWEVETSGIFVGCHHIATDRESQAQLASAYTSLKYGLIADTPWKVADGIFTVVTLSEIERFFQAVAIHVSVCFSVEQAHSKAIKAIETQADLDAYDINAGWPTVTSY